MHCKRAEIIDYLMVQMISKGLKKGAKLPSENELADRFSTTRINVRTALERLVEMGYIRSQHGKGYFVKGQKQKIGLILSGSESFSHKMKVFMSRYQSINLGCEEILYDAQIWHKLGIENHQKAYKISRLRKVDMEPIALHFSYVSSANFPKVAEDGHAIGSMYDYYIDYGYRSFQSSQSVLSITFPTLSEQEVFQCTGLIPLLLVETDCVDSETGRILEMTKILYKGEGFKYLI